MAAEEFKKYKRIRRPSKSLSDRIRQLSRSKNLYAAIHYNVSRSIRKEEVYYETKGAATMSSNSNMSQLVSTDFKERDEHNYLIQSSALNRNIYCSSGTKLRANKHGFEDWIHDNFQRYVIGRGGNGLASKIYPGGEVRFDFSIRRGNLDYVAQGLRDDVIAFETWLESQGFSKEGISIVWAFGSDYRDMETFQLPLQMLAPLEGAYPWLNSSVADFTKEFLESKASILILIGQPGTGKTSLIKQMIAGANTGAMVTYDTKLLFTDGFFASFMTNDECNLLVLEDADIVMGSRKEGNTMMHKFLNASDGLVSLRHKKIIFTTNLPSIQDVDPALIRQGRCFDVVHARHLTKDEAQVVADQLYSEKVVLDKSSYSLAEITNLNSREVTAGVRKVGF